MKVKNLIAQLQKLDPEYRVVRPHNTLGYVDLEQSSIAEMALFVNDEWYHGPHELALSTDFYKGNYDVENVVLVV